MDKCEAKLQLQDLVDEFSFDVYDEYREVELSVIGQPKWKTMFGKKDYDGVIERFRKVRRDSAALDPEKIPDIDPGMREAKDTLRAALRAFRDLCDAQIKFQTMMKNKASGQKVSMSDSKLAARDINDKTGEMQRRITDLNIMYADYLEP